MWNLFSQRSLVFGYPTGLIIYLLYNRNQNFMFKNFSLLFYCFFIPHLLFSQVLPGEGSNLNYRLIGFSFPEMKKTNNYKVEIASGSYYNEESFKKNIIKSINSKTNKIIGEVPSFGKNYTWRIVYTEEKGASKGSKFYHFKTGMSPNVDTNINRLRIIKSTGKNNGSYIFLDGNKVLYDMNGHPVWYLPDIDSFVNENCIPRDIKLTQQGTITLLVHEKAYEISYNGDILWKVPNKSQSNTESQEPYHHEFTRLGNGHYMVLGMESGMFRLNSKGADRNPGNPVTPQLKDSAATVVQQHFRFGKILEFDNEGNVIWSYKTSQYFMGQEIINRRNSGETININPHDNSFYFDEQSSVIYISFRDINRIIKIKYPEGKVLADYGEQYNSGVQEAGSGLFCKQHCVRHSANGYLYLFNNNNCNLGRAPKIVILQEPVTDTEILKKIWEYECSTEDISKDELLDNTSSGGGSVEELPDKSFFTCMGVPYGKVFIVNRDKAILWSAVPEKWNQDEKKWKIIPQYRASIITDSKQLEHLVMNEEIEKR